MPVQLLANMTATAMQLQLHDMTVASLRCHDQYELACAPGINLIVGDNGSGKTTLLEAISLMAYGRSFRQARDANLVRFGHPSFRVSGRWQRFGPMHVEVQSRGRGVEVHLQGRVVQRRADLMEVLPVIVEAPQGRNLMAGPPNERRRWLDQTVVSCREGRVEIYHHYFRAMMQRNRLLRRSRWEQAEIEAWEQQIVRFGLRIMETRERLLQRLNACLVSYEDLAEARLELQMQTSAPATPEKWLAQLHKQRRSPSLTGLRCGPHCDRLLIRHSKGDIRSLGSHGQQRLAATALRLAEWHLHGNNRGVAPVLLLDDGLEALDNRRREKLVTGLQQTQAQVFITAPEVGSLPTDGQVQAHRVRAAGDVAATKHGDGDTMIGAGTSMEEAA